MEVLFAMQTFMQTVVATQKSELLFLETKHIERLLLKRHPRTVESMKSDLEIKLQARKSQLLDRDIPLISRLVSLAEQFNALLESRTSDSNKRAASEARPSRKLSDDYERFIPARGALVDIYGEGTVFHRIRERDKAKKKEALLQAGSRVHFRPDYRTQTSEPADLPSHKADNAKIHATHQLDTDQREADSLTDLENKVRVWLTKDFRNT